jgi:hypothetical protein
LFFKTEMSIANLYGKTPAGPLFSGSTLATKSYIPGGVTLSSPLFEPAAGFLTGNVVNGRSLKVFYTKIGNLVTITCRAFISTAGAVLGDAIDEIRGLAAIGVLNAANLGPDIVAQLNNDILVKDANNAAVSNNIPLRIPGLFVNATDGTVAFASLEVGQINITATANALAPLVNGNEYYSGSVSFVSQNAAIVV